MERQVGGPTDFSRFGRKPLLLRSCCTVSLTFTDNLWGLTTSSEPDKLRTRSRFPPVLIDEFAVISSGIKQASAAPEDCISDIVVLFWVGHELDLQRKR